MAFPLQPNESAHISPNGQRLGCEERLRWQPRIVRRPEGSQPAVSGLPVDGNDGGPPEGPPRESATRGGFRFRGSSASWEYLLLQVCASHAGPMAPA